MLQNIATITIGDEPLSSVFGIVALVLFITAATIPFLQSRAILNISMKWHMRIAATALICAILHVTLMKFV